MIRYRIIYFLLLAVIVIWFILENGPVSFAALLTGIMFPLLLHIWLVIECKFLRIRIAVDGEMKTKSPIRIRVAAIGKHHASIGFIKGNVLFHHVKLDGTGQKPMVISEGNNLLYDDFEYQNEQCGVVSIQTSRLRAYDCFGLSSYKIHTQGFTSFVLYPEEKALETINKEKMFGSEFIGIRNYREGDHLSSVHWKLSSKWDKLYVKEYSEPEISSMAEHVHTKCQTCTFCDLCYNDECK